MPWEPVSGTLTFPVGSRTATVVVTLIDNVMTCDFWALSLDLTDPVNAVVPFQDNRSWIFNEGAMPQRQACELHKPRSSERAATL